MFSAWKQEKAIAALVDEAQVVLDKLTGVPLHVVDRYAAATQFWACVYLAQDQNLHDLMAWRPAAVVRFASATQTRIVAMRKNRDYDSSDGLAVWLHTARALTEPKVAPVVREIWQRLLAAGPNAQVMAQDLLAEAGLPVGHGLVAPKGFADSGPGAA